MKVYLKAGAVALAAFAIVAAVQRHAMPIPVLGPYLPK
jgi:hypothetical protein